MTGNSVLHIEMRRWADILVVAPASANLLSKAAYGIADNFVLSVMRAWDFRKPCALCPAMNTAMWLHPTTKESITRLTSWGWEVLGPVEKVLACNERGNGAMVSVQEIKQYLLAKWVKRTGGVNALTDANLQLHGMLINSAQHSQVTESEPARRVDPKLNHTAETADLYAPAPSSGEKSGAVRMTLSEDVQPRLNGTSTTTQKSSAVGTTRTTTATSAPTEGGAVTATAAATRTAVAAVNVTAAAAAEATKPLPHKVVDVSKHSTATSTTTGTAVSTPSVATRVRDVVLQSFLLGVGIGVGLVAAQWVVGALSPAGGTKGTSDGVAAQVGTALRGATGGVHRATV